MEERSGIGEATLDELHHKGRYHTDVFKSSYWTRYSQFDGKESC